MSLCPYKFIFGKPREGVHGVRLFNLAVVDITLTILGGYMIAKYFKLNSWKVILLFFILGELLHWLFCVDTTVILWIKKILNSTKHNMD